MNNFPEIHLHPLEKVSAMEIRLRLLMLDHGKIFKRYIYPEDDSS